MMHHESSGMRCSYSKALFGILWACSLGGFARTEAAQFRAVAEFQVFEGDDYLIRVGGYRGAQGAGRLMLSCFDDCNSNAVDDLVDMAGPGGADCNNNLRLDACDRRGNFTGDQRLMLADHPFMANCMGGVCPTAGCAPALYTDSCCLLADVDEDGDVDMRDIRVLQFGFGSDPK